MESIFLLPKTKGVFDMELKAIQLTKQYGSNTTNKVLKEGKDGIKEVTYKIKCAKIVK